MFIWLPWLTSGSTTNGTPGSGSTDSASSTGSTSDGSVTIMHECDARIKKWTKQQAQIMKQNKHAEDDTRDSRKLVLQQKHYPISKQK